MGKLLIDSINVLDRPVIVAYLLVIVVIFVFINLYLKTKEVERQAAYQQWLLDEHGRVKAEKARTERALRRTEARQQAILKSLPIVFHSRAAEPPFPPLACELPCAVLVEVILLVEVAAPPAAPLVRPAPPVPPWASRAS